MVVEGVVDVLVDVSATVVVDASPMLTVVIVSASVVFEGDTVVVVTRVVFSFVVPFGLTNT